MSPDRRTARWLGGALLGVVALGMAAATLTSTVSNERAGESPGLPDGTAPSPPATGPVEAVEIPFARELLVAVVAAILALAVVWALANRKRAIQVAALTAVAVAVLFWLLSGLDLDLSGGPADLGPLPEGTPGATGSGDDGPPTPTNVRLPPVVLVAVLGVALLVAATAVLRSSGDDGDEEPPAAGEEAAAVGRVAGRAAERIREGTDADNEVYRAWREMTGLLDVDRPASTSPGEFATAAVDAGMAREDVDELTRLFEEVRYGGAEPSAGLEERAVAAFERIEATYAEDG